MPERSGVPFRGRPSPIGAAPVAVVLILAAIAAVQADAYLNHDVAWFTWGADRILHGAVLGRDLVEPNFPLAYLVYVPAALLGQTIGLSAGLKLWMLALAALSLCLALPRLDRQAKIPFLVIFGIFLAFAMPREAGQREQIALLLVLPYCLPSSQQGWRGALIGVMAGIGFAIKPHFLIAWVLVELGRKPFRTEQLALLVTGAAYAISILVFFPVFAFEMLPITRDVYSAFDRPDATAPVVVAAVLSIVLFLASVVFTQPVAKSVSVAALGFTLAAYAQQRLYVYYLLPPLGLLSIGSATLLVHRRSLAKLAALVILAGIGLQVGPAAAAWWRDDEDRRTTIPQLTAVLDRYESFAVFAVHPYPAFPTAIYTRANYVGISNSQWFLPAVAKSGGENRVATENAIRQAVTELSRKPQVVIVDTDWRRHTATSGKWNGLEFLIDNQGFGSLWRQYRCEGLIDSYEIHIRKVGSKPAPDGSESCKA